MLMECHESELMECVASLSHFESFHCSYISMAQVHVFGPSLVTFVLFAPRVIHM